MFNLSWAVFNIKYNNIGKWEVAISNYGKFGQTPFVNPGAFWPRNTGKNYIYGAGIWIGGILPNGDTAVTIGYEPYGGGCEFAPGEPYSNYADLKWRVYFSSELNYPFPIVSFEDGYAIYNDFDPWFHIPIDAKPMGITVILKTHTFPKQWADDVLFFKYIIKNDTTYTINNLYAGICMDYEIGSKGGISTNDRGGIDLPRKLFFGWQEQPEPGWDSRGMIGWKLLSPYPLSCFKRFTQYLLPHYDWQRYMTMAGYNYHNGNYEPFDTIWFPPDAQVILISAGPWNLPPGDSIILDWVLIASHDSIPPSPEMEYKADKSQLLFNTGRHNVNVTQPNGGEVVSDNYPVLYTANSVTPNPLLLDFYLLSEHGYDTIALSQTNTGNYTWNTTSFPDGVLNKLIAMAYDTVTFGGDISDGYFVINNPGNASPYLLLITPLNNATLMRDVDITWFARDPEFLDSLYINIYFRSQYDSIFQPVALNEPNDSHFVWNTLPYRNGRGLLVIEARDEEFTAAETISVYLLNQVSGGPINQIGGRNNCVNLSVLVHQPEYLTGHTYEIEFLNHKRIRTGIFRNYPEYIYKITDLNTGIVVLDTYSLRNAYFYNFGIAFNDFSPIIDGFSIKSFTQTPNIIYPTKFRNDSVKVISGNYPQDSIIISGSGDSIWWAYRGSRLQIDWVLKPGGGLTLLVIDLDYGDTIPYKPYSTLYNPDSAFGWCFRPSSPGVPASDTLRPGYDKFIFLCGSRIQMAALSTFPQVGDRWIVYPSQYSPPIKGNIYRFTPINYVAETKSQLTPISFSVYPVPFTKSLMITYSFAKMEYIKIGIYDILGREVKRLVDGMLKPGNYTIRWNGLDDKNTKVSAGVYFCRFETIDYKATKKIILLK